MKHLLTLALFAFGLSAIAQFPNLPYNPDENGDGLIGVVDLQGLLANYGSEFEGAVLSENGNMAVVGVGTLNYFDCLFTCASLPGRWTLIDEYSAALALPLEGYQYAWMDLRSEHYNSAQGNPIAFELEGTGEAQWVAANVWDNESQCFCAAKQLRKVEYTFCNGAWESMLECAEENTSEGWYPLGDISPEPTSGHFVQAFWRWAE